MKSTCPFGHKCKTTDTEGNVEEMCVWYTRITGTNPQTGEEDDDWGCAVAITPVLLVEVSKQNRNVSAAIESFRNEMSRQNNALQLEYFKKLGHIE